MNIVAVLACLDIDDLDQSAKHALLVVACRANRHNLAAWLSIGRVADDMAVNYTTARRALERAVDAGYLTVDKSPGRRPKWQLTSRSVHEVTSRSVHEDLVTSSRAPSDLFTTKDVRRMSEGEGDAATATRRRRPDRGKPETPEPAFASGSGYLANWTTERLDREHENGSRP